MTARDNIKSGSDSVLQNSSVLYKITSFQYSETLEKMMNSDVYTCSAGDNVKQVAKEMTVRGISSVIVTDALGKPLGIVTERDMVRKVVAEGDICDISKEISEIMTPSPICLSPADTLFDALYAFSHHRIKHLPQVHR